MTTTIINRIDEYQQRRIAWLQTRLKRRQTDRREYVHFCAATFDGALAVGKGCGQILNTSMADDFVAHCPNCSKHDDDYRVFRYYGDPLEYDRSARSDRRGRVAAALFAVLAAAILFATLFV